VAATAGKPGATAIQQILDADGNVVSERSAGQFEYHETHNHWHIGSVALFELRPAAADGTGRSWQAPFVNDRGEAQSIKTTFCLIDWYRLEGNANTKIRTYWDCIGGFQGISPGWVDQYHQSLEGQEIDITGPRRASTTWSAPRTPRACSRRPPSPTTPPGSASA
jgi:hypothetical protein